MIFNIFNPIIA